MKEMFKISVRELVAFSFYAPDILPAADAELLRMGTKAHKMRQAVLEGAVEQSVRHIYEIEDNQVQVFGRMDVFTEAEIPEVEEIKLSHTVLTEVRPEHRAQAVCYAAMVAEENDFSFVKIIVCYVAEDGMELCRFEEKLCAEQLKSEMHDMLRTYLRYALREARHHKLRNESLKRLPFPFDSYRKGQRELAVQVYTAILRRKRLFASLPTGTGKSAAVLYPALKAMGEELTERVVYLTSRNTARQSPVNALTKMLEAGMDARCSVLSAKEKLCPSPTRCHPNDCPRAGGHFIRQEKAVSDVLNIKDRVWDDELIRAIADKYAICPFEFALTLTEIADVIIMDLNYAFDPFVRLKRLFQKQKNFTLLIDEAHHTVERVRESLSGVVDSRVLAEMRTEIGKKIGRKNAVYRSLTQVIRLLRELQRTENCLLDGTPEPIVSGVRNLLESAVHTPNANGAEFQELIQICLSFLYACEHQDENYAVLLECNGKERTLTLYCLLPAKEIKTVTERLKGSVFFSATLQPLQAMKRLLGGTEEDACFSLPSPFPPQRLRIVRKSINTRFENREHSAREIAEIIHQVLSLHPGNTIVFFPSYAYLNLVSGYLDIERLPDLWVQKRGMAEEERNTFLNVFEAEQPHKLGLCVLGGLFSEGIDLPGKRLVNAIVVGVGLPVPSIYNHVVREYYQKCFGDGFGYACRIPGIQKVLQAAGRVIRSEDDSGMVVLIDDRYDQPEYAALLPDEWVERSEDIAEAARFLEELE